MKPAKTLGLVCALLLLQAPLLFADALVNINTADKAALVTLNGIGEVKAQAIIDYRSQHGPFAKIDDIIKVSGIGPATFDKIKSNITVSSASTTPTTAMPLASSTLPVPSTTPIPVQQPVAPKVQPVITHAAVAPAQIRKVSTSSPKVASSSVLGVAATEPSGSAALWFSLAGLGAVLALGVGGVWYLHPQTATLRETPLTADEFDIE